MNVYVPAESIPDERRNRFLDWRFLAALTALVLVAFLVWAGFRNYEIRAQEAAQKDALIGELSERADQVESLERDIAKLTDRIAVLTDRARTAQKLSAEERRAAARERRKLIRQQERMLALLQAQGIEFRSSGPVAYVLPVSSEVAGTEASRPARSAPTRPPKRSRPPQVGAAAPTAGKSGKTPPGNAHGVHKN